MAVVVVGKVQPLTIGRDNTIRIIQSTFGRR